MKWMRWIVVSIMASSPALCLADGKAVYDKACAACHAAAVAGAPKLGDKAAWAPRTGQGKNGLVQTVVKGKGAMPPKAGNAALKDSEIADAVDYMLAQLK